MTDDEILIHYASLLEQKKLAEQEIVNQKKLIANLSKQIESEKLETKIYVITRKREWESGALKREELRNTVEYQEWHKTFMRKMK